MFLMGILSSKLKLKTENWIDNFANKAAIHQGLVIMSLQCKLPTHTRNVRHKIIIIVDFRLI